MMYKLFMGFSWQEYRCGLPFPSPVDHVLSELVMVREAWQAAVRGGLKELDVTERLN